MKKIIIASMTLLSASICFAIPNPGFYVGGGGSYLSFDDDRNTDSTFVPIASLGYTFSNRYGAEVSFAWINSDRDDVNREVAGYAAFFQLLHYWPIPDFVKKMKSVEWDRYSIVSFSGLGYTRLSPNGDISSISPRGNEALEQANLNGGVGLSYEINCNWDIRAEIKDTYTLANDDSDWYFGLSLIYHFPQKA